MSRWANRSLSVATIGDVARLAGVSSATVSRVVNADKNVSATTREKVAAAVRTLNYSPNIAARNLASAARVRLGVIYRRDRQACLGDFLPAALDACKAAGVELLLFGQDPGAEAPEADLNHWVMAQSIRAVLLPFPGREGAALSIALRRVNVPVVAIGRSDEAYSSVRVDDHAAAFEMTRYLLGLGHRRIGLIAGPADQIVGRARRAGFEAAVGAAPGVCAMIESGDFSFDSGRMAAERLLARADRPTAIFACNDDMAASVISVAHRRGLETPRDLTVVGFDDTQIASILWPALTTVRQPVEAMTAAAVDLALEHVRAGSAHWALGPTERLTPHDIVHRQSAGPPAAAARGRVRSPVLVARNR